MGKIRVKTIGVEEIEEEEKKKAKIKREEKKARLESNETTDEEITPEKTEVKTEKTESEEEIKIETPYVKEEVLDKTKGKKEKKDKFKEQKSHSGNYTLNAMKIEKNKYYPLTEAIELLKNFQKAKFDETVELHINTTEPGINGTMTLPHGTGKETRVKIADDEVISEIEKGKINFDILIATPSQMPSLAKVAKILGPRGLMPNPKNGTISEKPKEAMKKFQGGQIGFKTESKLPLIHLTVGKISFTDAQLKDNIIEAISSVKKNRIKKITLKSTMSPGIKLQV
jgi:large subunit ribosomal protein L1